MIHKKSQEREKQKETHESMKMIKQGMENAK